MSTRYAHCVLSASCEPEKREIWTHKIPGQRCSQDLSGHYFRTPFSDLAVGPCNRLRGSTRIVHAEVRPSIYSISIEFSVQELFRTECSIPRTSGHNVDLPALYRPATTDTCFAMSSALRPLVQTSGGVLLPDTFACCTTFRAFRICLNKKLLSTCLSLSKP